MNYSGGLRSLRFARDDIPACHCETL